MDSLKDLLKDKANDIDVAGKRDDIDILMAEIDRFYPKAARVISVKDGTAHIATKSSTIASDLRLQRVMILQNVNKLLKNKIKVLRISIR